MFKQLKQQMETFYSPDITQQQSGNHQRSTLLLCLQDTGKNFNIPSQLWVNRVWTFQICHFHLHTMMPIDFFPQQWFLRANTRANERYNISCRTCSSIVVKLIKFSSVTSKISIWRSLILQFSIKTPWFLDKFSIWFITSYNT